MAPIQLIPLQKLVCLRQMIHYLQCLQCMPHGILSQSISKTCYLGRVMYSSSLKERNFCRQRKEHLGGYNHLYLHLLKQSSSTTEQEYKFKSRTTLLTLGSSKMFPCIRGTFSRTVISFQKYLDAHSQSQKPNKTNSNFSQHKGFLLNCQL